MVEEIPVLIPPKLKKIVDDSSDGLGILQTGIIGYNSKTDKYILEKSLVIGRFDFRFFITVLNFLSKEDGRIFMEMYTDRIYMPAIRDLVNKEMIYFYITGDILVDKNYKLSGIDIRGISIEFNEIKIFYESQVSPSSPLHMPGMDNIPWNSISQTDIDATKYISSIEPYKDRILKY